MKYEVKVHGRIGSRLQRVAESELAAAIAQLEAIGRNDVVHATHETRKHLKKLRALLSLLRSALGAAAAKPAATALRDAGRCLRSLRDAHVLVRALDVLRQRSCETRHPAIIAHARRLLVAAEQRAHARCLRDGTAPEVIATLREVLKNLREWELSAFRWKDARRAIRRSYRRARQAHHAVVRQPTDTRLHTWRKRLKELLYHARLLRPADPAFMDLLIQELKVLTEFLGDDRDLALLRAVLRRHRARLQRPRQFTALIGMLDLRCRELRRAALDLGAHLLAESPAAFARELDGRRAALRAINESARRLAPRLDARKAG